MTEIITPRVPVIESIDNSSVPTIKSGKIPASSQTGLIAQQIGTGEHARDSFIWMTLRYCFYSGAGFSICIVLAYFYFILVKDDPNKVDIVGALKDVWSIFTPILTLALGYAFGKREREEGK
ncbi:TPA: hypothetical protein OOF39_000046 [Kluyvera ascorbata]|nr:hypothetical protein [Kluyvera ascorbata]